MLWVNYQNLTCNLTHKLCASILFIGSGLLRQIELDDSFNGKGIHPYSDGVIHETWTFRIGLVDSFGGSFVDFTKMTKI